MSRSACLLSLSLAAAYTRAEAQAIRGTVVDSATHKPLDGFVAVLEDEHGASLGTAWSRDSGHFFMQAPGPGQYAVRVQRLGYRKTTTPLFTLETGATRDVRIDMTQVAARLAGLHVDARPRCEAVTADGAADVATAWQAARTAFELLHVSSLRKDLIVKVLDAATEQRDGVADVEHLTEREGSTIDPYPSASPDSVARVGYVRASERQVEYYAPAPRILMSESFMNLHCFRLERSQADTGRIGIAFEPTSDRSLPDVAGVVWLNRSSSAPIAMDFRYTSLPSATRRHTFGGHADFISIPDGGWLMTEWSVRAPILDVVQRMRLTATGSLGTSGGMSTSRVPDSVLVGTRIEQGHMLSVRTAQGKALWTTALGNISGFVLDSTTQEPIRDVAIRLRGSPRTARTDARGAFAIDSLLPGKYTLMADFYEFGVDSLRSSTTITLDTTGARITLSLPLARATLASSQASRTIAAQSCKELRDKRERDLDAEFQIPLSEWRPHGAYSAAIADAARRSAVVLEGIADTTGSIDVSSIRVLRGGQARWVSAANDAIRAIDAKVEQPQPGCKLRHLVIMPYVPKADQQP